MKQVPQKFYCNQACSTNLDKAWVNKTFTASFAQGKGGAASERFPIAVFSHWRGDQDDQDEKKKKQKKKKRDRSLKRDSQFLKMRRIGIRVKELVSWLFTRQG